MFDMSWGEVLVIGTVALVAIGPKELPKALRMAGQVVGKVRRMAGEFQAQFNEAMREADLEELRKTASDINDAVTPFKSSFDPLKSANEQLQKVMDLPGLPELPETPAVSVSTSSAPEAAAPAVTAGKETPKAAEKGAPKARAARQQEPKVAPAAGSKAKSKPGTSERATTKSQPAAKPVKTKSVVSKQAPKSVAEKKPTSGKA